MAIQVWIFMRIIIDFDIYNNDIKIDLNDIYFIFI